MFNFQRVAVFAFSAFAFIANMTTPAHAQCGTSNFNGGPYHCEAFDTAEIKDSDENGITIGGVRPGGIYWYRFVEDGIDGASIDNVLTGLETDLTSRRGRIRDSMNRWEAATDQVISWRRCDKDSGPAFPACPLDPLSNPAEVVIGIDTTRTFALGCSHPWKTEHPTEPNPLFQGRRMAFNSEAMAANDWNVTHELGHCLGLIHTHQRQDRSHWISYRTWESDAMTQGRNHLAKHPVMENFSFSSPMLYPGDGGAFNCGIETRSNPTHAAAREIGKTCAVVGYRIDYDDAEIFDPLNYSGKIRIPPEASSEVKQLHAKTHVSERLNYFNTLSRYRNPIVTQYSRPVEMPLDPSLRTDRDVYPTGSPALMRRNDGNNLAFIRGTDNKFYWRGFDYKQGWDADWTAIDPSAIGEVNSIPSVSPWSKNGAVLAFVQEDGGIVFTFLDDDILSGKSKPEFKYVGGEPNNLSTDLDSGQIRPVMRNASNKYIGVAIVPDGMNGFDIVAVRENQSGKGQIVLNRFEGGTWSGWNHLDTISPDHSIVARPAAVDTDQDIFTILATTRISTLSCGITEYVIDRSEAGQYSVISSKIDEKILVNCSAPPEIAKDVAGIRYHAFLVDMKGDPVYRRSDWAPDTLKEIGGLPKPGTGMAVAQQADGGLLILMNGSDVKGVYNWDPTTNSLQSSSLQAGGVWFRRWSQSN